MQRRVLIRARGLASFRRTLVDLALAGGPLAARRRAIVVPTRAAGALLRLTIEQHAFAHGSAALICPDIVTREEWLARMAASLAPSVRWLDRIERHVMLEAAIHRALALRPNIQAPFELRPGIVAAMLDFYDELRRRNRRIRAFARTMFDELRVERGTDRGSEGLIEQTRFLGFAFLAYERAVRRSGGVDEHELRARLLREQPQLPCRELVVAVADHPADPRGLWPADFDLIGRLRGCEAVHVVMTDEAHDAGFRARVERELPGIEEQRAPDIERMPVLVELDSDVRTDAGVPVAISRDREEELRQVARHVRARAARHDHVLPGPTAVVFHRPLPYLYLAQQVLTDARVPYQAFDTLPLAAEPYAALVDLALAVARTEGSRDAVLALLRSPLARFEVDGEIVRAREVHDLARVLAEERADGAVDTFEPVIDRWEGQDRRRAGTAAHARRAARAGLAAAEALAGCREGRDAAAQVRCLAAFLRAIERRDLPGGGAGERVRRARAAVLAVLDGLADALARVGGGPRLGDDLAALVYHALEAQTFAPARGRDGVHLVDAAAARFGEFDDVFLVGLVETDWAERQRRSFFYSAGLLKALGWPQDAEQDAARQAAFRDVLTLARRRTRLSAFELDGETVVGLATILDGAAGLPREREELPDPGPLFADELLTGPVMPAGLEPGIDRWLRLRRRRPALDTPTYSGRVAAAPPDVYRVSRVDRYAACPFRYFSEFVLQLVEERPEAVGLSPLERGSLLHTLLERFYRRWDERGMGAVTTANLPEAHALFAEVTDELLATLPPADRALERMRIAGSIVAPGVADRVLELEARGGAAVVRRLLEESIEGRFVFPVNAGLSSREIAIRGKADRIDVLADDTLRIVDYKLGRVPDASSLQAPIYAYCARQLLAEREGKQYGVAAAMYVAFGEDRRFTGGITKGAPEEVAAEMETRASEFAAVVERIERGEFPPRPVKPSLCAACGYAGVCRKEYQSVDDVAAEPV